MQPLVNHGTTKSKDRKRLKNMFQYKMECLLKKTVPFFPQLECITNCFCRKGKGA